MNNEALCALIEAVAGHQDRDAFAELFRYFAPRFKAIALRQGADGASAEELAQEAMLLVWRKAYTFDRNRASASTWMFTILRNKRIDLFRKERRPEADIEEAADQPAETASPEESYGSARDADTVRRALKHLPGDQLLVLEKAFFEEKSHSAIAEELQLPLGTVKSRIRLALSRLRGAVPEIQA